MCRCACGILGWSFNPFWRNGVWNVFQFIQGNEEFSVEDRSSLYVPRRGGRVEGGGSSPRRRGRQAGCSRMAQVPRWKKGRADRLCAMQDRNRSEEHTSERQ